MRVTTNKVVDKTVLKVKMAQVETVLQDKAALKETDLRDKADKTDQVAQVETDLQVKVERTVQEDKVVETVLETTTDQVKEQCLLS